MERVKSVADQVSTRAPQVRGRGEEATKQALILPMLDALGYDIWDPSEVCPEFEADFAVKKFGQKEKVDLAVLLDGTPRIYFEVKAADCPLDGHEGQLARYFNASPSVSLAILTNGIEYRFFTDTGDPNVMDSRPFYTWRVDSVDTGIEVISKFQKSQFSAGDIREYATELIYTARIVEFLRGELDLRERNPGESFVRWILGGERIYEGRVTASVVERFSPIIKNALQLVLRDIVRRSLVALDQAVSPAPVAEEVIPNPTVTNDSSDPGPSKVQTTDRELACLEVVTRIFSNSRFNGSSIYEPSLRRDVPAELGFKDTTGYFGVYLNKPGWWCLRIMADAKQPWVAFNLPIANSLPIPSGFRKLDPHPFGDFRLTFSAPQDLDTLSPFVLAAFAHTIGEHTNQHQTAPRADI